tara:strand:+ start:195 stop:1121 length:927 start_codon:yes stop_codon:yes gene_type:complete
MKHQKLFVIFVLSFVLFLGKSFSQENKILFKINNEIITSLDILEETNYLSAINDEFNKVKKNESFEIAKNSLIREKIKEIELIRAFEKLEINEEKVNSILLDYFKSKDITSIDQLRLFFKKNKINPEKIKKKFKIEIFWNRLIYLKFKDNIKINREDIKLKIKNNKNMQQYLLSEILFEVNQNENLENKFKLIKKNINENSFSNAALLYSVSSSSEKGGKLGWINSSSINLNILNKIKNIKIGNFTNPIVIPGGFLILKIEDKREVERKIDLEKEMNLIVKKRTNEQLNQFSNIYFNKIKKNVLINEL